MESIKCLSCSSIFPIGRIVPAPRNWKPAGKRAMTYCPQCGHPWVFEVDAE